MTCSKAKLFVDYRGKASAHHVRNKSWSVNKFIRSLREQKLSWRRIHWKIWGIVNSMACVNCGARFICAALGHCRYHPEKPTFDARSNVGRYVRVARLSGLVVMPPFLHSRSTIATVTGFVCWFA